MKVKTLVKTLVKSNQVNFKNEYSKSEDHIIVDGVFEPLHKALSDKRKVESWYVNLTDFHLGEEFKDGILSLIIKTSYPTEISARKETEEDNDEKPPNNPNSWNVILPSDHVCYEMGGSRIADFMDELRKATLKGISIHNKTFPNIRLYDGVKFKIFTTEDFKKEYIKHIYDHLLNNIKGK